MAEFENEPDAAEIMLLASELRIYDRDALRQRGIAFMVIEHNSVDAERAEARDLRGRGGSAIHRDEKLRRMRADATRDAVRAESVSFLHAMRQKTLRRRAKSPKDPREQSERSDTVYVVISVKHDTLAAIHRAEDPLDCGGHVRQQKRITQGAEAGRQKLLSCLDRL